MSSAEYMPLGRHGEPYRPDSGLSPLRVAMLVGVGLVVAWFVIPSSSPTVVPSDPEAEARMRAAQAAYTSGRVVHAIEDRGEGDDDALRDNPKALFALRQALREAVAEAKAVSASTDPLEILAHKLLARRGGSGSGAGSRRGDDEANAHGTIRGSSPQLADANHEAMKAFSAGQRGAVKPSVGAKTGRPPLLADRLRALKAGGGKGATTDAGPVARGLGGPGAAAPNGGLHSKLPTAAMWPPRFTRGTGIRSPYESLGKLEPYRGGDLELPGELQRAAAARSYNGELILTYGNEAGTAWISNLVFSLRSVGIEHFLVIVSGLYFNLSAWSAKRMRRGWWERSAN